MVICGDVVDVDVGYYWCVDFFGDLGWLIDLECVECVCVIDLVVDCLFV